MITTDIEAFFAAITVLAVAAFLVVEFWNQRRERKTVSYTHLTLPTICSV